MQTIHQTVIRFPEIQLATRDAHKLRGFFGDFFKEHSSLLHNHLESGESAYRYPLVQYKVLKNVPTLVGLNEGAELLIALFLQIKNLEIDGRNYPVLQKNIDSRMVEIGLADDLQAYRFDTLWMALNQQNHDAFLEAEDNRERLWLLKKSLTGNILSFFKAMNCWVENDVLVQLKIFGERETQFKNKTMMGFQGEFVSNAQLPELVGLGKSVARGFGTIVPI